MDITLNHFLVYTLWDENYGDFNFIKTQDNKIWCVASDLGKLSKSKQASSAFNTKKHQKHHKMINIAGRKIYVVDLYLMSLYLDKNYIKKDETAQKLIPKLLAYYKQIQ